MELLKSKLPTLAKDIEKNKVALYSQGFGNNLLNTVFVGEAMPKEYLENIKKVEAFSPETNLKVVAILKKTCVFPGNEVAEMDAYVYIEDDCEPWEIEDGVLGFYAWVDNKSWGIQEIGSIGIKEHDGFLYRVY